MAKVEIIGPKSDFFDVVSMLHDQGKVHIEDLSRKIQEEGEVPLDCMELHEQQQVDQERMEELLIRVRSILKALHRDDAGVDPAKRSAEYERLFKMDTVELKNEVAAVVEEVEDRTAKLAVQRANLESETALLARYEPILQKIQPLAKQIMTTGAYESVALLVERRYKQGLELLKEEIDKITHKQCEIVSTDVDEDTTAAIMVFSKTYSDPVHKFLAMENVNQIRMPSSFEGMPFDMAYETLKDRRRFLPAELEQVSAELEEMSREWLLRLSTVRDVLLDKLEEMAAFPKFGRTQYAFVICGWIPVSDLNELRDSLAQTWGDDIIVTQLEIRDHELAETPVALKNPKVIAPFSKLMSVRGVPKYGTVDPTIMLFIFFPFIYGMIVGDIGYGLVLLAVIIWLRRKFRNNEVIQLATSILGPAATMAVAFGFVYGDIFGDLPYRFGMVYYAGDPLVKKWFGLIPVFYRVDAVVPYLLIALVLGALQVAIGLVVGVINAVKTKHNKHLQERGGILTVVLSVLMIVGLVQAGTMGLLRGYEVYAQLGVAGIALAGFVFAIRGGGVMGVIETVEAFTHIASYIRIMAVGLAGGLFANAINQVMYTMDNIVLGIFLGIILHALHVIMAAFSPLIHALRLNLLEFFSKFYETGTQPYSPFTKTGGGKSA